MAKIGSVHTPKARKAMLLGSGELGKEVAFELQRLGVEVIACDKYPDAPAMQVATTVHTSSTCSTATSCAVTWSLSVPII